MSAADTLSPADELAIRRLVDRYFSAIDSRDADRLRECFSEDPVFVGLARPDGSGGHPHVGVNAVVAVLDGALAFAASCHVTGNVVVEVDGDTATADTFAVAFVVLPADGAAAGPGRVTVRGLRYRDALVRTARGWRIRRRTHCPLWQYDAAAAPLSLPGTTERHLRGTP